MPSNSGGLMRALIACLFTLLAWHCQAESLRVAVASNFRPALEQLAPAFTQQTNIQLSLSSGASGQLVAQIQQGAPFDIFLSADAHYPHYLYSQGLADTPVTYARGRLLLIGKAPSPSWQELLTSATRVGLANPELAPYGAAAKRILETQGLWPASDKQVYALAANISQVQQWFDTGQLDAAFVAASLARTNYPAQFDLTSLLKIAIEQQAVILKRSQQQQAAQQFLYFLQQRDVQLLLANLGYHPLLKEKP